MLRLSARTRPIPRQLRLQRLPRLYTPTEAAVVLRCTPQWVKRMIARGCLGGFRGHSKGAPYWTTDLDILAYMGWVSKGHEAKHSAAAKHGFSLEGRRLQDQDASREKIRRHWRKIHEEKRKRLGLAAPPRVFRVPELDEADDGTSSLPNSAESLREGGSGTQPTVAKVPTPPTHQVQARRMV